MLYFIHHPSGNVILLTNNPYIVLHHQRTGWLTATSLADALSDHPEWSLPSRPPPTSGLLARFLTVLESAIAVGPASADVVAPVVSGRRGEEEGTQEHYVVAAGVICWMTALERKWYWEHGWDMPTCGWITCVEGEEAFEYRLEMGLWELSEDMPPSYAWVSGRGKGPS